MRHINSWFLMRHINSWFYMITSKVKFWTTPEPLPETLRFLTYLYHRWYRSDRKRKVLGWFRGGSKISFWSDHVKSAFGAMVEGWFKTQLLEWPCKINFGVIMHKSAIHAAFDFIKLPMFQACRMVQGWFKMVFGFYLFFKADFTVWPCKLFKSTIPHSHVTKN